MQRRLDHELQYSLWTLSLEGINYRVAVLLDKEKGRYSWTWNSIDDTWLSRFSGRNSGALGSMSEVLDRVEQEVLESTQGNNLELT